MRRFLIFLIRVYRSFISPLLPMSCRFKPTCSEYAMEVIDKKGVLKGLYLVCWRLLKCHPFHPGGYDPVK